MVSDNTNQAPKHIGLQVDAVEYTVIPGRTTDISIVIINLGAETDYFEVSVRGIPSTWATISDQVSQLAPQEQRTVHVSIQTEAAPQVKAGQYEVKLRASSQGDPKQFSEVDLTLKVAALEIQGRVGVLMETTQFTVAPDSSTTVPIVVTNRGLELDSFRLAVEGIPISWVSSSSPQTKLGPGEEKETMLIIRPPRDSQTKAGRHPFTLRIVSQEIPDQVVAVDCILTVAAFTGFAAEIDPVRVDAQDPARVIVSNQGNIQETYTVTWQSNDDELVFEPEAVQKLRVAPGEMGAVEFSAQPAARQWLGGEAVHNYVAQVDTTDKDTKLLNGEVVSRALIPIWALLVLLVLCITLLCGGIWFVNNYNNRQSDAASATQTAAYDTIMVAAATQTAAFNMTQAAASGQEDTDGDGLTNQQEVEIGTDPLNPDTDADELGDGEEYLRQGTDPLNQDSDGDTLSDGEEVLRRQTDPLNPDTDQDGLNDGDEVLRGTDPLHPDTDRDELTDGDEVQRGTDPLKTDSDDDKLNDGEEVRIGTNPLNPDTDSDGLIDGDEAPPCPDPLNPDTDGDGIIDGQDLDPCDPNNPSLTATAGAGQPTSTSIPPTAEATTAPTEEPTQAPPSLQGVIALESNRDGNAEIYSINAANGTIERLTLAPGVDTQPDWSPDGNRIAFTTNRDGNNEIYVMNADGTGQTNLTNNSVDDQYPTWSPDGQWIAFATNRDGNNEVYVMRSDGSDVQNITNNSANDSQPSWFSVSRFVTNDEWIGFTSDRDGNQEIYTMRSDGSEQINISLNPSGDNMPKGNREGRIVFNSNRDGNLEVYVINLDGTGAANLTNSSSDDLEPTWSPDGQWIAFSTNRSGNWDIFVMQSNGADPYNFSNNSAQDRFPAWK